MLRAGTLNKRVKLQSLTSTADGGGGFTESWTTGEVSLWARVSPASGSERFRAQQLMSERGIEVEIRYRAGVNAQQRFLYGTRALYITQVLDPDERHERLLCLCEEREV